MSAWQFDTLIISEKQIEAHFRSLPMHIPLEMSGEISGWPDISEGIISKEFD